MFATIKLRMFVVRRFGPYPSGGQDMAKIFQEHPFKKGQHAIEALRIARAFPGVPVGAFPEYLSLTAYIEATPQRFYSRPAFTAYLEFLESTYATRPKLVIEALRDQGEALELAHRIVSEVNRMRIHDSYIPESSIERIQWIDGEVNQLLLRLWEASLHGFLLVHSHVRRRLANKGLASMDIYNTVQETEKTALADIGRAYDHNVRNGIGHGKVTFTNDHVIYRDKKGTTAQRSFKEVVRTFDNLIDTLNALALAQRVFWSCHQVALANEGLQLPKAVLFEELRARVNMPGWQIEACLESARRAPKRQLEIHLRNSHWDFDKVQYWAFYTAYWAERLTGSFESIFLQFRSSSAKFNSWAGYNAERMRELRAAGTQDISAYKGVLESDLMFFVPRIKFPRWILKLGTYRMAFLSQYNAWMSKKRFERPREPFQVRHCAIHAKWGYSIIPDAVVILNIEQDHEAKERMRVHHRSIVRGTIAACRRSLPWYSLARYLPVRYARIMVHATDKRRRHLQHAGLPSDLIGTVGFNTSGRIKNIEIIGGTLEERGKYRLVWNSRWRGGTSPAYVNPLLKDLDPELLAQRAIEHSTTT